MRLTMILLAGLALVALASSTPADAGVLPSVAGPTTFWENTQTQKCHCEGKDVVRCETATGSTCIAIDSCETYCFVHDNGAACVDMGEPPVVPKVPISKFNAKFATRNASPQKNKHYQCSKDRTGVLICMYGFCSTEHYCKSGDECKDASIKCEPKVLSALQIESGIRGVPKQAGDAPPKLDARNRDSKENKSHICSKDCASVLKCAYGFCATDYYCAKRHLCVDNPARCKKAFGSQN